MANNVDPDETVRYEIVSALFAKVSVLVFRDERVKDALFSCIVTKSVLSLLYILNRVFHILTLCILTGPA